MKKYTQYKHSKGYILVKRPKHPTCDNHGYVPEHRVVMEKHLGRYLSGIEGIHHINGIKDDNRLKNLMLCSSRTEHIRIDRGWKKINGRWFKPCSGCKRFLEVNDDNFYFRKQGQDKGKVISPCKECCIRKYNRR